MSGDTPSSPAADERQIRIELAALYRVFVHFGWTDLTYTHISARVPGEPDHYLVHPYGVLFEEVTASNLLKVRFDGRLPDGESRYNQAGHLIHTAVLEARPEINFVLHSHTRAGTAVSAMECGLLPLSEHANAISSTVAYHSYEVFGDDREACRRMAHDLGESYLLIQRNHGLLACGRTAAEAFLYHYFLQLACEVQVDVMGSGQKWVEPPREEIEALASWGHPRSRPWGGTQWRAMLRKLEREDPSFQD